LIASSSRVLLQPQSRPTPEIMASIVQQLVPQIHRLGDSLIILYSISFVLELPLHIIVNAELLLVETERIVSGLLHYLSHSLFRSGKVA
jgi:hypothetical protein